MTECDFIDRQIWNDVACLWFSRKSVLERPGFSYGSKWGLTYWLLSHCMALWQRITCWCSACTAPSIHHLQARCILCARGNGRCSNVFFCTVSGMMARHWRSSSRNVLCRAVTWRLTALVAAPEAVAPTYCTARPGLLVGRHWWQSRRTASWGHVVASYACW